MNDIDYANTRFPDEMPTPVGDPCAFCGDPIKDGQRGRLIPHHGVDEFRIRPVHDSCLARWLGFTDEHTWVA